MWRHASLCTLLLVSPVLAQPSSPSLEPVTCDQENDCLAKLQGKASRRGRTLILKLENGKSKTFMDSKNCATEEVNCTEFTLRTYRPAQGVYVVHWSAWEGGGLRLVSAKTGEELELPDDLHFSPSGNRFVVTGDEYDHRVIIGSIGEGEIKQELAYDYDFPEDSELWSVLGWDGENRIRLQVSPSGSDGRDVDTDAVLKEQGWVLNWPFPN